MGQRGMTDIKIRDVTEENIVDLCQVCISPAARNEPDWVKGAEEKRKWAVDMVKKWGSFAKLAYIDGIPAGMIQYKPVPEERIVYLNCIFVPEDKYWQKGIGTQLLSSVMEDVKRPLVWFDNQPASALVTRTFPGGAPNQLTARQFFKKKGFKQVGKDPDYLYYPLKEGFVYKPKEKKAVEYLPQKEDKGKVLIICGPDKCPATYPYFLKRMEKYISEIEREVPIVWIDTSEQPEEVKRRNASIGDCIVNAKLIKSFVLDKSNFQKEVKAALKDG